MIDNDEGRPTVRETARYNKTVNAKNFFFTIYDDGSMGIYPREADFPFITFEPEDMPALRALLDAAQCSEAQHSAADTNPTGATMHNDDAPLADQMIAKTLREERLITTANRLRSAKPNNIVDAARLLQENPAFALTELERELADALVAATEPKEDPSVKRMVDRFLRWKLPEHFRPDCGISFTPARYDNDKRVQWPTGTNLLDANQAEEMVRHMIEGTSADDGGERLGTLAEQATSEAYEFSREAAALKKEAAALKERMARFDEIGWVIERHIHNVLHYWAGRDKTDWRLDHMEAVRFSRRADAEFMLTYHCEGVGRVADHMWVKSGP